MRQVGIIPSLELAQRFRDYLLSLGIGSQVREQRDGFAVWVYDEDAVPRAKTEFGPFASQPDEAKFKAAVQAQAAKVEAVPAPSAEVAMPRTWAQMPGLFETPVTLMLLTVSVALTLWAQFGEATGVVGRLVMSPAAFANEPWRIVLPVFLHFGPLHLLFNMLWLKDLGGMIENLKGRLFFGVFVLALATFSNVAQYVISGPGFGGMSGVVYGLFGYIWVKSKREPWSGFLIDQQTVWLMMAWFALCFTGWFGPIANFAHGGGLALGLAAGLIPGKPQRA